MSIGAREILPIYVSCSSKAELSNIDRSTTAEAEADVPHASPTGLVRPLARVFPVMAYRDFRYLWLGQLLGASAMWMEQVARNWLTWELTQSPLQLGIVNFVRVFPSVAAGLFAGVMADRISKRRLLLVAQMWAFFVYAIMTWVIFSGRLELWHLYASTMALALGMSVTQPVRAAFVPALVPNRLIIGALSLNATAMNGSRFVWPAVAGVIIASFSSGWAYLMATVFYVLLQGATLMVRATDAPDPTVERGSMMGDLADGFRFVLREKVLFGLMVSRFGPITVASGFQVLIPVFAVEVLGMGVGAYGVLLSAEGLGAIIGGSVIASRRRVPRQGLVAVIAGTALGLLLIATSFASAIWLVMLLLLTIGISQIVFQSANNAAMFGLTPPNMRGRMVGVRNQNRAFVPVSNLGAGAIAQFGGVPLALGVLGALSLVVLWAAQLWRPGIRKV